MTSNIRTNFINNIPSGTNINIIPKQYNVPDNLEFSYILDVLAAPDKIPINLDPLNINEINFINKLLVTNKLNNKEALSKLYHVLYYINTDPTTMTTDDLKNRIDALNTILNIIINNIKLNNNNDNTGLIFFIYYTIGLYLNDANDALNSRSTYNLITKNYFISIPIIVIIIIIFLLIIYFIYKMINNKSYDYY